MTSYKEFQSFSTQQRLDALKWLRGRREVHEIFEEVTRLINAANDAFQEDITGIILYPDIINMLYCWKECGQDEVLAKISFVADRKYGA